MHKPKQLDSSETSLCPPPKFYYRDIRQLAVPQQLSL